MAGLDAATLSDLEDLYTRGRFLTLHARLATLPFRELRGLDELLFASRVARNLGNHALEAQLELRTIRLHPQALEARALQLGMIVERRSLAEGWRFAKATRVPDDASKPSRSIWAATVAKLLVSLRDFDRAEAVLASPDLEAPWVALGRASILAQRDRYEEALALLRTVDDPRFGRIRVLGEAAVQTLLGRRAEALTLLSETAATMESGELHHMLALLCIEEGRWADASLALDDYERCSPLLGDQERRALAALRSNVAYHRGDRARCIEEAQRADTAAHRALVERLRAAPLDAPRRLLDVPFVRQHHLTCAPATLSALARWFAEPVDHLEIAEAITYDGTPAHSARQWAEARGWIAREFTVDVATVRRLVDADLPFLLTTVQVDNGHAQAVVGYDLARGTIFLRDPYQPLLLEAVADELLFEQRASGPRGLLVVPPSAAARVPTELLPDEASWTALHEVHVRLSRHDRPGAVEAAGSLAAAPSFAERAAVAIAHRDEDFPTLCEALDRIAARTDAPWVRLAAVRCLVRYDVGAAQSRLAGICGEPHDPMFDLERALLHIDDVRRAPELLRWIGAAMRARPDSPTPHRLRAELEARRGDAEGAFDEMRFAACLAPTDEALAMRTFAMARSLGRGADALAWLSNRCLAAGRRSALPWITLAQASSVVDPAESRRVLDRLLEDQPTNADAACAAAQVFADLGDLARAEELLARNGDRAHPRETGAVRATIARRRGDPDAAIAAFEEILTTHPFDEAHEELVELLLKTGQGSRAVEHLDATLEKYPHHRRLLCLRVDVLSRLQHPRALAVLDALLQESPEDPWALRQQALLVAPQDPARAAEIAQRASTIAPHDIRTLRTLWIVHELRGDPAGARTVLARAFEIAPDDTPLASWAATFEPDERPAFLRSLGRELLERTIQGTALGVWYELAVAEGIADDARALMQRSVRERPELLAGWSSYVAALLAIGETDEAAGVAERACARFPHAPRAFVDASVAAAARGDGVAERAHLEHALTLEPTNLEAVRQMVVLLVAADELDAARAVAERASRLGGQEHARLFAQVLRRRGELALALTTLERALRVDPFELDLWHDFHLTSKQAGAVEGALPAARALSATGPREPRRVLPQVSLALSESRPEEALAALEPLAVAAPFRIPVQRARAEVHLRLGDTGAALAALSPVEGAPDSPALALDEAHIQLSKGDWDAANTAVERAHRLAPNDFDVLHRRLEIASAVGDEALACSVGRRLVALFPSNPNAHSLLGSTLLGAGQPDAARAAFATAVRLDPMHPANRPLFTLERIQVHEGAPATLARLAAVLPPGELRVSAFRLALARRDDVRLRELVDELCVEADLVLDRITDLGRLCALAGRHKLFYRRIAEHLDDPSARGVVGEWLAAAAARRNARLPNPFDLPADLPAAQGVARVQLVRLATSDAKWPFTTTVFRFRRWLRADPASVAVVFEGFRRLRRNWTLLLFARGIGELSPAARFHLGFALRELGLAKRAERLHRAGIDDPPEYATCHRIALAFAVAGRGDPVQVSRMLAPIEERFVPSWLTTLLEMARALHKVELDGLDLRTCVPQLLATAGPYQQYMARKLLDCGAGASLLPTAHPWACFGVVAAAALVVFAQAIGERRYLWWAAAIVAFIVGQAILRRVKEVA